MPPGADPGVEAGPRCYRHPDRETWIRCVRCDRPICPDCMRDAPVGFQCPDDAAEGRRVQRAPRTSLGAVLRHSPPYVTATLIALNVVAYLASGLPSAGGLDQPAYSRLFQDWQLQPYAVDHEGSYYRLLTSAFLHENLLHIGVNMLSLAFVGPVVERSLGRWRFLALYLLGALGSGACVYAFGARLVPVIGASGAIFALLGACLVLARRIGLDLQWLVGIIAFNFVFTFSVAGVSRLGHVGGFVAGLLVGVALGGIPGRGRATRVSDGAQAAGLAGVLALVVVVVAVRTATF